MKRRFSRPVIIPVRNGYDRIYRHCAAQITHFAAVKGCVSRQHQLLLGVGIFLLLCWTIGSIWLINVHQGEKGAEELLELQTTIAGK